ncbi:MAG: serine/threonine-protein phosphatase [Deltaproteobacteria bacterium]|nr:serine/threonine-protein phosphatase [Deltaproteobacteria bacterium]
MKILTFGQTNVGMKRDHNEDAFLVDDDLGLYLVADGMGGHAAGEVASSTAVEVIIAELRSKTELIGAYKHDGPFEIRDRLLKANEIAVLKACAEIYRKGQEDKRLRGMGTTLSSMLISGTGAFIAHVGDSRIYLIREGQIHQLTVDHSLINEQLKRGTISKDEARKAK